MKEILQPGTKKFRMTCSDCGAVFTYERSDVLQNYMRGGEWVSCPSCGHQCRHFGAAGYSGDGGRYHWTLPPTMLALAFALMFVTGCLTDTFEPPPDAASDAPGAGDAFAGDSSTPLDGGDAGISADANGDASDGFDGFVGPTSRRVFITSKQWTANLGGTLGADAKCQAAANSVSLGGTWMSWTSTSTSNTATRFIHSSVPWKLLDGTLIANDWSDLTSGSLENHINRDENGNLVSWSDANYPTDPYSGIAWTDTSTTGHWSAYSDCSDFTDGTSSNVYASAGYNGYSGTYQGFMWTDAQLSAGYACNAVLSLLCFEQ